MSEVKPRKGCLKSPNGSSQNSPVSGPPLGSVYSSPSANASYASFAEACADLNMPSSRPKFRKAVSFCSEDQGLEEIHVADEWDRTPTEPVGQLSYQDILELKAIQRTLPRAQQLPDPYTGKPASQYLSAVPIGLLPLTDSNSPLNGSTPNTPLPTPVGSPHSSGGNSPVDGSPHTSPPHSPALGASYAHLYPHSPHLSQPRFPSPLSISSSPSPEPESERNSDTTIPSNLPTPPYRPFPNTNTNIISPHSSTLPYGPPLNINPLALSGSHTTMKRRPNFAFLPLLDTPPSSGENTPVSPLSSGTGTPSALLSPEGEFAGMRIVGLGERYDTPRNVSEESESEKTTGQVPMFPLAEPSPVAGSFSSQQSASSAEPSSFSSESSASSSYASDSEVEATSSGYTGGSPLSRTTSVSSVAPECEFQPGQEHQLGLSLSQFEEHNQMDEAGDVEERMLGLGLEGVFQPQAHPALRDPRLRAVASPSLAPPSPLNLDAPVPSSLSSAAPPSALHTEAKIGEVLDEAPPIMRETHAHILDWEGKERLRREGLSEGWTPWGSSVPSTPTPLRPRNKSVSREPSRESEERFSVPVMDWEEKERLRREASRFGPGVGFLSSRNSSRAGSRIGSREDSRESERIRRNVVEINGVEVDLGDEDDKGEDEKVEEEAEEQPVPAKKRNVMVINGIEIDLDEDEE